MKMLLKSGLWALALFGFWSLVQAVWLYHNYSQDSNIAYQRNDSRPVNLIELVCGEYDQTGVKLIDMAILAAATYVEADKSRLQELSSGWKSVTFSDEDRRELFPTERVSGLHFDLWINAPKKIAVISFRGTSDVLDWHANMHWVSKYIGINTQYQKVRAATPNIVSFLQAQNSDLAKIYTVGHSLGGGLAQHMVYNHPEVTHAFVFNSSPVTGWNDIAEDKRRDAVAGNFVTRIHEDGEILEFLRLLMKIGYTLNPKPNKDPYFEEYRVNFEKKSGPRHTHVMEWLADEMISYSKRYCKNWTSY
jgi:hypothetical protein